MQLDRPTVRQCKWFWRVHLAAPTMPIAQSASLARDLSAIEFVRNTKLGTAEIPGLTWRLAYQPWASKEAFQVFIEAVNRLGVEIAFGVVTDGRSAMAAVFREHYDANTARLLENNFQMADADDREAGDDNG